MYFIRYFLIDVFLFFFFFLSTTVLSGAFIYTRARVYLCSRAQNFASREKPLPWVSAAGAAGRDWRRAAAVAVAAAAARWRDGGRH